METRKVLKLFIVVSIKGTEEYIKNKHFALKIDRRALFYKLF